jgi:hypothetical protein
MVTAQGERRDRTAWPRSARPRRFVSAVSASAGLILGNRRAAAEFLETPHRTFYDRVEKWPSLGKEYQKMARAVEWRKEVGRKIMVPLGESLQSGETGEPP